MRNDERISGQFDKLYSDVKHSGKKANKRKNKLKKKKHRKNKKHVIWLIILVI